MRKLAVFALSFSAAVFAAQYIVPEALRLPLAAVFALIAAGSFLLKDTRRLALLLAAVGLASGFAYDQVYSRFVYSPFLALDGQTGEITALVCDYPEETVYGSSVYVRIELDGAPVSAKTLLYLTDRAPDLKPGYLISLEAKTSRASVRAGEETTYYIARGIFLTASQKGEWTLLSDDSDSLRWLPQKISRKICETTDSIYPEDCAPFMRALMTGDRSLLNRDKALVSAMSDSGISHVVAVSGMHISFLTGAIMLLCGKRRKAALICIPVILLFMAVAGWTPSVVRAGILQLFMLVAPLVKREVDKLTSLSAALLIMLIFNPFSACNVGLQLSFAASAGIGAVSGKISTPCFKLIKDSKLLSRRPIAAVLRFICSSVACTIGALLFTTPLIALYFGYVSLVSVLTNLCTIWAVSIAFTCGLLSVLAAVLFAPAGVAAAWCVSWLVRYIRSAAFAMASLPLASVYTESPYITAWLVGVYALLLLLFIFRKRRPRLIIPLCCVVIAFSAAVFASGIPTDRSELSVTAVDVGQGQSIVITTKEETFVVDCGGSVTDAGSVTARYLKSINRPTIDILILTHFHADHANGVTRLIELANVRALMMPYLNADEFEYDESSLTYCYEITTLAKSKKIDIIYIREDSVFSCGSAELRVFAPMGGESENERCLSLVCSVGDKDALITGDLGAPYERRLVRRGLPDMEVLIVGHHGSKYSTCSELLEAASPEQAIISVGSNSYGHPTQEVLERLAEFNIAVYRTDVSGTVTVKVD